MERPRSMIVASQVPQHRRNASSIKSISKIQPPSTIASQPVSSLRPGAAGLSTRDKDTIQLYINNLRLLDLHQLSDWPHIAVASFSNDTVKTRLKCAEWSLYQLFRLYDQPMTTDKLQPFFPPLEPLQSVNLRAALYRCFNELKKNGALGREIILRKTMLDDCTGDKFWELCLSFSNTVVRKVTLEGKQNLPVAQRLATAKVLSKKEKESLLPLAVAHKSALSKVLTQKHNRRQSYIQVFDSMRVKEEELVKRKVVVETQPPIVESAEHADELQMIEQEVGGKWTDDVPFKNAMINGDPAKTGDHAILASTDEFIADLSRDESEKDTRRDSGVLEDISFQAKAQSDRVKEWQAVYAKLQASKRSSTSSRGSKDSRTTPSLQFDQHHNLGSTDVQPEPVKSAEPLPPPTYVSRYDEILTNMREELRRAHAARREAEVRKTIVEPPLIRKPSITLDAVAGAPQVSQARSTQRSFSPTFPFRPDMLKRASSRSYTQPKVISQREPIPLKSELYSPLKGTGSVSPASARSSIVSPIEDGGMPGALDALFQSKRESQGSVTTPTIDSGIGLGLDFAESPVDVTDDASRRSALKGVSFAHRKSLSERTRMSMAFTSHDDGQRGTSVNVSSQISPESDTTPSLAARTRQSMAGISVPLPVRASPSFTHSRSSSVIPQILAPKQRLITRQSSRSFSGDDHLDPSIGEARRDITPREALFNADAEYNSVFKSRPKIAQSPPLSPIS